LSKYYTDIAQGLNNDIAPVDSKNAHKIENCPKVAQDRP